MATNWLPRLERSAVIRFAPWLVVLTAIPLLYYRQKSYVAAFRFDDSYITLRYAQQLARHGVLSFNVDERIDGYTSLGWTLLLALAEKLGLDGASFMLVLSSACGFLSVWASVLLARLLGASWPLTIALSVLGTLYTPGFVVWSVPGMEMPFAALSYTALLSAMVVPIEAAAATAPHRRATLARLLALFAAAVARPEGALLAGMLWSVELTLLWRALSPTPGAFVRAARPYFVLVALGVAFFLLRWNYYGYPLPNTFYAKSSTPGLIAKGIEDAREFFKARQFILAPIAALGLAAFRVTWRTRATLFVFVAWYLLVFVVYARSGGDFPGLHRFYQPLVPAAYAVLAAFASAVVVALSRLRRRADDPPAAGVPSSGALRASARFDRRAVVAHTLGALLALWTGAYLVRHNKKALPTAFERDLGWIAGQTEAVQVWERAGLALRAAIEREHAPLQSRVATRAAGAIPYYANADRVYDMLALNNPDVAHNNPAVQDVPAHQKEATTAQILGWNPNLIVGHPLVVAGDISGTPPDWYDVPEFRQAGFRFRCLPMQPVDFFCYWQR